MRRAFGATLAVSWRGSADAASVLAGGAGATAQAHEPPSQQGSECAGMEWEELRV
jgi:hypothetical protein